MAIPPPAQYKSSRNHASKQSMTAQCKTPNSIVGTSARPRYWRCLSRRRRNNISNWCIKVVCSAKIRSGAFWNQIPKSVV